MLVSPDGEPFLFDFGSAQICTRSQQIFRGVLSQKFITTEYAVCTPLFSPPDDIIVSEKYDVYALGCVLFKLLLK